MGCGRSDDGTLADSGAGEVGFEVIGFVTLHTSRSMGERRLFRNRSGGRSGD